MSWDATIKYDVSNPVYAGAKSISYIANTGWAGFQVHLDAGIDTKPYTHIQFAARGTANNQRFSIFLDDVNWNMLSNPRPLASYGGDIQKDVWKVYSIPLADLGAASTRVAGIAIHEWSGSKQGAIYLDEIKFVNLSGTAQTFPSVAVFDSSPPRDAPDQAGSGLPPVAPVSRGRDQG